MIVNTSTGKVYFTRDELKCKGSGECTLNFTFANELLGLRAEFDRAMTVTSCCRSKAYNEEIEGHPRSLHICDETAHGHKGTAAIDIKMQDGEYNHRLLKVATSRGWSIGINFEKKFFHLDRRTDLGIGRDRPVVFSY
ncbi:MAG: hypothetical protein JKY94_00980 [Rhodobacteraceae bacterium]|nr:hypothetical protein [Paracoccaceae bacterium]